MDVVRARILSALVSAEHSAQAPTACVRAGTTLAQRATVPATRRASPFLLQVPLHHRQIFRDHVHAYRVLRRGVRAFEPLSALDAEILSFRP